MSLEYECILNSNNIYDFIGRLSLSNCKRCSLSDHDNRIVVYRGNPEAEIMLIGEAAGKKETQLGKAFVGPAGQLLDEILQAIDVDTNKDVYIGNICKCQPVAAKGSGRENYTPRVDQTKLCKPYILREIELINPKVIILAGLTPAKNILDLGSTARMGNLAGTFTEKDNRLYFTIYHPASLIHARKRGKEAADEARQKMWKHVKILKNKLDQLGVKYGR